MKNSNKKAGDWGALKNKPQNEVYFKAGGKVKVTAGGEKHVIYKKTTKRGEGKVGNIMVNHPTKDKGVWDTIDLTKKSGAKTVQQGIASTKKWHKENPYNDMKKQVTKKQAGGMITQMRRKHLTNKYNKLSDKLIAHKNRPINPILMSEDYLSSDDPAKVKAYDAAEKVDNKETKKFLRAARAQGRVTNKMDKIDMRNSFKQAGGATKDSTSYFKADKDLYYKQAATNAKYGLKKEADEMMKKAGKAAQNELRQKNKGRLGYDKNGYPVDVKKQLEEQELLRRAKKMGHNTIEEYKKSNWGYGKNKKMTGGTVKKYQKGGKTGDPLKATADSTKYFYDKSTKDILNATKIIEKKGSSSKEFGKAYDTQKKSLEDLRRQSKKGKAGYDANGHPVDIQQQELLRRAKKMGHDTIEEYRNSNWGYGKNKKMTGGSVKKYNNGGTPPKVKTRTVTTNPGGYSKTITKTKTVDRPGKQGTVSTTRTRPTIKGVASDYASGVRKSVYGFKEAVDNKRAQIKNKREQKMEIPNKIKNLRQERKAARPLMNPANRVSMKKGGSIKKKK